MGCALRDVSSAFQGDLNGLAAAMVPGALPDRVERADNTGSAASGAGNIRRGAGEYIEASELPISVVMPRPRTTSIAEWTDPIRAHTEHSTGCIQAVERMRLGTERLGTGHVRNNFGRTAEPDVLTPNTCRCSQPIDTRSGLVAQVHRRVLEPVSRRTTPSSMVGAPFDRIEQERLPGPPKQRQISGKGRSVKYACIRYSILLLTADRFACGTRGPCWGNCQEIFVRTHYHATPAAKLVFQLLSVRQRPARSSACGQVILAATLLHHRKAVPSRRRIRERL